MDVMHRAARKVIGMLPPRMAQFWIRVAARLLPRRYFYLDPDTALTILWDGHAIFVDPRDEQIAPSLIVRGAWEPQVEAVVRRLVRRGDRVIEVGANHGYFALIMASRIGPAGSLTSFEANPRLARLVSRSLTLCGYSGRAEVRAVAAGDREGRVSFVTSRSHSGGGHLAAEGLVYEDERILVDAPMLPLDLAAPEGRVDLLRMDAEGAEPLILAGAAGLLARSPGIVICMEWDRIQMSTRADVPGLLEWLGAQGLRFWQIMPNARLRPVTAAEMAELGHSDVVICRSHPYGKRT